MLHSTIHAEEVHIGTVVSSVKALNEIIHLFEKNSPNDKVIIHNDNFVSAFIYKQIKEKNDLDILVSGNTSIPLQLENEGLTVKNARFTYVFGKLVLWSRNPKLVDTKGAVLGSDEVRNIALLDPKLAPYGVAAEQVLGKLGVWNKVQSKLVIVGNSGDMQKQVLDGTIDLAFIPLATLNPSKKVEGSLWIIPKNYYEPIEQQAVLLKRAENNAAAKAFFNYLKSPQARNVFEKYGFSVP
ncbi:MAG: molybdate ABC transporter substrate-binding protein [Thiotrichaceae bacterium]|nr:molybdate ABC transporter substrate-binding protein [Thiotrichaceae bacterium]